MPPTEPTVSVPRQGANPMTHAADTQASLEAVLKDEIIRMYEEGADQSWRRGVAR